MYRGGTQTEKGGMRMEEKEKALHELLKLLADHPDLAERITITIKPSKIVQDKAEPKEPK